MYCIEGFSKLKKLFVLLTLSLFLGLLVPPAEGAIATDGIVSVTIELPSEAIEGGQFNVYIKVDQSNSLLPETMNS
jgi:hypothetical protein